jgi:saccharopine dehydrogenase-like NADP-dependent oxidoreductase
VTSSYISPEMKAMEEEVKSKGLLWLNECGVDPGIDHILTM